MRRRACRSSRQRLEAFAEAFAAHADATLADDDLHPVTTVDAVVSAEELTLPLAQELDRLAPFGLGNPDVMLLVPAAQPFAPATVGEGKHLRFRVRQNGRDAGSAIAFGQGFELDRLRATGLFDVACRLKENRWNGTVAPQLVVRRLFDTSEGYEALRERLAGLWRAGEGAWTPEARSVFAELGLADRERGRRRQLLESETFRALLEREAVVVPEGRLEALAQGSGASASRMATASLRASRCRSQRRIGPMRAPISTLAGAFLRDREIAQMVLSTLKP